MPHITAVRLGCISHRRRWRVAPTDPWVHTAVAGRGGVCRHDRNSSLGSTATGVGDCRWFPTDGEKLMRSWQLAAHQGFGGERVGVRAESRVRMTWRGER